MVLLQEVRENIYFHLIIFNQQKEGSEAVVFQIHLLTATPSTLGASLSTSF